MIIGDLNIDTAVTSANTKNYLVDLCDTFCLTNIIKEKTCYKSISGTSIDVMLTNKPRSFQKTSVFETGISDHHKLIATLFRAKFTYLPTKKVKYRNYKKFDNYSFLHELEQELLKGEMYKSNKDMYSVFTNVFISVVNKHAPLKSRTIRAFYE